MTLRVYIANLAKYNEGKLVGQWIDVPSDIEELQTAITEICGSDEWAIHDVEGFNGLGEHPDLSDVIALADALDEYDQELVEYADTCVSDRGEIKEYIADNYRGTYSSKEEWAESFISDCYDLDRLMGNLARYFDYEAFARDCELGGDQAFIEVSSGVAVFDNH